MSSITIDQPQSEKNQIKKANVTPHINLRSEFSNKFNARRLERIENEKKRAHSADSISRIEKYLAEILTSPAKAKLLLMFMENLRATAEPKGNQQAEQKPTAVDDYSSQEGVSCNRNSLPQIACPAIRPRTPDNIIEPEERENMPRVNNEVSRIEQSDSDSQIVMLGDSDSPRPTLKKFDIDELKPRKRQAWSQDVDIALRELLGPKTRQQITDLERSAVGWKEGYRAFCERSHASDQYAYIWADVHIYRTKNNSVKKEFITLSGVDKKGTLTLLTVDECDSHSAGSWRKLLTGLEQNNLAHPRLFVGDNNLPIWDVLADVFPRAQWQFCWDSIRTKIRDAVPKEHRNGIDRLIEKMRNSQSELEAVNWAEKLKNEYSSACPHAVVEIMKSQDKLFTYYSYPRAHWNILKSSGQAAGGFPPDELLATIFKYEPLQQYSLYLVFNYLLNHYKKRARLNGKRDLKKVLSGKYPRGNADLKPEIEFIQTQVVETKKAARKALKRKLNNYESGGLIQPGKRDRKTAEPEKVKKSSNPKKRFQKIVMKRMPEPAPVSDPRTEELRKLLRERIPEDTQLTKKVLLDNLGKLGKLDKSKTDRQTEPNTQNQKLSVMEMEILAGKG